MGEYAIRKRDRERIKIGTCADLYYLRFDDRHKLTAEPGSANIVGEPQGYRYRLPFPDEDALEPGEYDVYNRSAPLWNFTDPDKGDDEHQGTMQVYSEPTGLYLSIPCHHGERLPDVGTKSRAFWGTKSNFLALSSLRCVIDDDGATRLYPVVRCLHCQQAWRYDWDDVWEFIDPKLRERLEKYREPVLA